jgi:hypothetical protein
VIIGLSIVGCPPVTTPLSVVVVAIPTSGTAPLTVLATATPAGGTAPYTFSWTSAPGGAIAKPTEASTNVLFATAGTYTITCTVTDSAGQTASGSAQVTVSAPITGNAANGLTIFNARCIGCHPVAATLQPNLVVNDLGTINAAMAGITLTDQEVADLKAFLSQ